MKTAKEVYAVLKQVKDNDYSQVQALHDVMPESGFLGAVKSYLLGASKEPDGNDARYYYVKYNLMLILVYLRSSEKKRRWLDKAADEYLRRLDITILDGGCDYVDDVVSAYNAGWSPSRFIDEEIEKYGLSDNDVI